jgi:signal transduction histidine kinase
MSQTRPWRAPTVRELAFGLAFLAVYVALDWMSFIHPLSGFNITPWNPQPALAIALLMRLGLRWVPAVYAALVASEWLGRGAAAPLPSVLFISAVLCAGYALIAWWLTGPKRIRPALDTQADALRLVATIACGALLTGAAFIAALNVTNIRPLDEPVDALLRFWIGDTVGIIVILPIVLMLTVPQRRVEVARVLRRRESPLHVLFILAAVTLVFLPARDLVRFFYVLFIPLILVASRLGLIGSTFAALVLQCAVIVAAEISDYQTVTVFEVQAVLLALTVTGLFLGVTVDERRRVQEELDRSRVLSAAGEMAAALAHELNQPLAAVANYARASQLLAGSRGLEYERLVDTLAKLVAESSRAAEVVKRLRDFFTTGDAKLEPIDLAPLLRQVAGRLQQGYPAVAIELRSEGDALGVLADGTQIEVVVRNLLSNAIEACSQGADPRVAVSARRAAGTTEVTIRDSGPGVAPEDLGAVFEPFMSSRATGMGMGLAISRAIIEAHGGRLWAEPGPGGRFTFTLPALEPEHG